MTNSSLQLRRLSSTSPTPRHISLVERAEQVVRTEEAPIWEPVPGAAPTAQLAPLSIPGEDVMIAAIERPVDPYEGHRAGNERRERELMSLFGALTVGQAGELRRRLTSQRPGDALAASFQRLVVERRGRLLAFLADARRREALRR